MAEQSVMNVNKNFDEEKDNIKDKETERLENKNNVEENIMFTSK